MTRLALLAVPLALSLAPPGCGGHTAPLADASGDPGGDGATGDDAAGTDGQPARDPAGDGDLAVTTMTASIPGSAANRTVPATIYLPTGGAPHPLVVISPGFQMARTQYASYAQHLATWGFVAVLTDYADTGFFADHQKLADDVTAVIDWALTQPALAIDPANIATAGHSLGGKISIFAATQDARIRAVVGWDPVDANDPSVTPEKLPGVTAAIAVVGETTDGAGGGMPCAPTADNFQAFYAASPAPAIAITVAGADHMDWVDDGSCTFCGFCTAGTAMPDRARTVTRRLDVAWLRRQLLADTTMDSWLAMPPELATGAVSIEQR